jgi:hypothetical protein
MEYERAEIKLKTQPNVNIYLFYDLKRDSLNTAWKWKINDQRLFLLAQDTPDTETPRSGLICIEGGPLENAVAQDAPFVAVRLKNHIPYNLDTLPYTLYFKLQR